MTLVPDDAVQAYLYDGYWEDIGTIESFYLANLALTADPTPNFRCPQDPHRHTLHTLSHCADDLPGIALLGRAWFMPRVSDLVHGSA